MARAKQLTISHENRPGMLAHIVQALGDNAERYHRENGKQLTNRRR